jgi:hypothetical protein
LYLKIKFKIQHDKIIMLNKKITTIRKGGENIYLINPLGSGSFINNPDPGGCHCGCSVGGMDTYAIDRDQGDPDNCWCQCECVIALVTTNRVANGQVGLHGQFQN